jgi:putative effector of murein hydrolase
MSSAWAFASVVGLLLRSVSTSLALSIADAIGGLPALTALFVVVTGLVGVAIGKLMLDRPPIRSKLARSALVAMGRTLLESLRHTRLEP